MDSLEVFLHLKDIFFHSSRVGWKNKRKNEKEEKEIKGK